MANVLDNNASVFKPKKDEQKKIETPVIKQASIPAATGALRALSTGTSNITPFTKNTSASVSKPAAKTAQPSLSSQSIQNDKQKGIDWSSASPAQRAYNDTYYKTLDEPTHTKMFRDLQSFTYRTAGGADVDKSEAFRKSYKEGTTYLDNELKDYEKRYGKDSYEYKALQQFKGDYESLGRQVMSKNSAESAAHLSRQLDDTIDSVFAGYMSAPDYQEKVEKGKKEILGNPKKYGTFTLGMKGASEKQKDLLYAVFAEEGEKGAEDFYKRFLNPTVSRIGAEQEFSETIASDSKAKRALGAAGAAVGGAIANSSILGGGVQKGIDVLTGKAKALDDDVLAGDFTVQDSVDNTLRREFAGINQADLDQYGLSGLDAMKGAHDGKKTSTGQYGLGNIDLTNRDTGLYDEDGNLMTVKSMSFEEDGKEILVPTIVKKDGKWVELSEKDAIDWYHQTGEYLGKFDTVDQANAYAQRLHQDQQQLYTDYDWLKAADQDATDYQKQLLGYVYLASDRDEAAAKDLWEAIKARDSEIRQTVNGGTYGTTSRDAVQSGLYQEYLDKNKLMLGMYKAAVTTGSQLDRVALSFIPVVGQALNLGTMGLSVFGNAYSEDVLNGREEDWKTAGHALTSAALEVVMEKLLSGVAHIPGIAVDEMSKRFVKNIANPWVRAAANTFLRFQSEGLEEGLTDAANALSTGLWFGEGNIASRAKQGFELDDVDLQQMLESYFYGGISALFLGGLTTAGEVVADINYRELGHHLNTLESTDKLIDTILNTKIDEKAGKSSKKLYDEAKELAQGMKDGKLKKNDINVGEMFANFAKSGGDVQWLTNPDTVNYNKDTLTEENFIAGATSRLAELGADTTLAGDIARWAMGQAPSQEAFNKIKSDPKAVQVLQELIDPLDMEQDNALTRAVQSTTRDVTGNKTYDTLVASNPDQTVVNPATQQLISLGVELEEAQGIGDVIAKVMSGESITEDEAELISVSNAAVRSVLSEVAGVELSENATIGAVMDALNGVAAEAADTKAKQAAVAEGAEAAARARMPIPPNTRQTITAGGIEFSHDEFIRDYMAQHNATLEQAEEAWAQRAGISAALNGEEENNGTTPGKQEGRNPDLAGRSPIPAATQRTAESGRAADTGGTEQSGRVAESGQSADLRRGYTDDQVIKAFNSKQRAFMRSCLDAGFKTTKLIKGPILRQGVDKDGNPVTYEANALVDDDGNLVIRWDNPYASPLRVALHERIHLWLSSMSDSERAAFVKQALQDIFGDNTAAFDAMYKAYADVYAKAYTGLTGEAFTAAIMEEMLADMYAGMNNYGANAGSYQSQAEMYVQQSGLREKFFGEEGGFSFDEQFSLNDPFRGDVDRSVPPEVRPFPGEKAMHDNMELLSLTSMAQGANFELRLNSQGQPYELIDKKTGKRVEHVTGEMMIDTPLGNIVQLAVDNGNIDADEAAQQRDMLASAMNLIVDYDDAALVWELVGSQMFSAVKANSDKQYNKTIDFSTICKKTMAIVDAMSETMKKLGRGLTRREVEIVYEEVGKKGLATPCPVCYVFSRWMGIGGLLDQMNRFQVKYGDMSEEDIVAFMTRIEDKAWEYAKKNPKSTYFDKDAPHTRDHMLIGKVISDMKSGPNSKAAAAIETLNAHQQALATIAELEKAKEKATPAMAKKYGEMIRQLRYNVKSEKALAEAEAKMQAAEADIEPYEEYQWLAKTMMISDSSQVNEDGESIGNWKKNPNFRPVPKDILFDLNKGGEFAKDYPLSWAFRTGKGCAAGKAIAPYSDARVGETIQGVAMDVKNIRVELDESQHDSFVEDFMRRNNATKEVAEEAWQNRPHNEFLTGDKKAQQQTLKSARKKQRRQNLIGGMRYQSTSDFRYEFGSDYLMTFLEMQALGANVQLYTKVIEAVDFLASTGADCNLSVMPRGDGYEEYIDPKTGKKKLRLIFSDITGINADAAIKKSQEYDNVQLILVGINDTNIRLALEGDEVTFVIPFHGSGQSVHQIQTLMDLIGEHLDVTQAQDYTSVQSDRAIKDRAEKHPELQAMWDLRMDIIMGKFLTDEQKETLKAWENATSQEEKTALANRLAELGKAQEGLSAEQKARLAQNKHLQKLYNMFYVDTTDPAFYNNLAKDQAEHIFPYEYWIKDGDYAHADENGRVFQEYCASIGVIPRFSGINSKYQKTGFGDFTQDKGYWKLLIDRSMYENIYDEKGNWIGYGKYRPQQQINMTNIDIGDLNQETGKAQFQNGEMSKQYDATRNPEDLAKRDNIVSDSIKRIEAMRGSADVVERNALDRTRVKKNFREKVMKAQSALREADQTAEPESEVVELLSIADGEPKEETVVYIKDGYNDETGEAVDFINAILDGVKKGETRNHNSFPYKNWVGLAKGKADGKVYGRVKFGKPYQITKESPEYQDALIAGTDYDIPEGGSKWYYPVLETEDFRDDPKPFRHIAQTGKYQRASMTDTASSTQLTEKQQANVDFNNNTSIVVTKNGAARNEAETPQERYSMVDKQFNDWAPEFYSKMERVVNDWTNGKGQPLGAKMAANQVVGWLKGKGVKSEEIKWSGIVPYLEGKKTVTKEELQQVMAENEVKIETKVLESGTGFKFWSDRDWEEVTVDSLEDLYEYAYFLADEEGFDPEYVKLYPSNDGYYITRDDTGEIIVDATRNDAGDTRWSEYKTDLQDGFNYREILFKQPGLNYTNRAMQVHWGSEDQDGARAEGKDVIAHARVQDTFTPETKGSNVSVPTIFIEEIQSDLHNAGTAKQTPKNTRGFTREHAAPGFAGKLQREYQRYLDIMDGRDLNPAEQSRYDWIVKQLEPGGLAQAREAYTQAMEQRRALDEDLDQVVAEIKERTRDFQQLGLLRGKDSEIRDWVTASNPRGSFRYADESFLDSLMNGSVNEAYSFPAELIARIENIRAAYQTSRDASEDLIAANRGLSMAPPEVPFAGSSDTYHEYVMKHMLRLAAEGGYDRVAWTTAQQQSDRWSDEYAEGYKIEYDQAIPKFMNKYVKQWGGKVGTTVLDNGEEVWSVDITPEMKDSVLHEGQPRFSVAPTDENSNPSPFKEGSLEATVSDLIQKADDGQALQDTINALIEKRNESLKRNNAPVIPSKDKARPVGKVQREIQQNQLQGLINKYGALKKGEKAAKDVTLPERTSDERYTRRFVRTTEEAAGIPERMNERIDDSLLTEDLLTYSRITDKMAVKKGDSDFKALGYKKAIKEWNENRAGTGHQPTKYDIAFGERLMIEAARNGDEAVALKVLADLASMETQAGQVVQAARLLKKLGPTGQLYYIQKAVDRLNKQNEGRIAKGSMQPITIDKELAKAVILSETDEQMKDAMDELIASIAEQLPVTLKDKWDAWRYLSMLGNPRTHIRNVFGNAVFSPIRFTKDLLASAGEKMFIKDPLERTKAADARLGSKKYDAVREFAASDFEEMKQQITGTGKMNPLNEIMDKRKIFKSKAFDWLNKLSDWNSDMLEKEDAIFLRKAYIDAMTQFIAAKGLTLEELTGSYEGGKILNDARQYAALEAQKATYRDFNQMASALNQMKRTSGVGWFIDGLMPFTKTPMNILRRGIEYSPVGLANGIYSSLVKVGKGDISAAGAIDQIAAGMTGTGIAILGYFLAKMGLARGGEDDDDKKAQLEAAEGHQNYSLEIPGYGSYTIDWMAPVALPFFVGVEVFNQLSDGGPVTGWDLANALTMIAEPMMSLSMLDGLNSTLSAVRYGDKDEAVMSVATNILTSYLSQGAPTIFGQIARTIDPDRRSTYTDKNSSTPAWLQRFVQGVQGKVPGVESQKMAYVDAWGRKDTSQSILLRAVENFISPGYANRINETPVDRELTRLAESLGDTSVLPSSISKYYQLNGEHLDLNAKQYEKLKTVTGQTAFSLLGNMMDDAAYIAMGDEEKAAVVKQIMSISAAIGKQAVTPDYKPDAWIQRAIDKDNLETAAVYHALKGMDTGLSDYQLISAMDWLTDEDRGTLIMEARDNTSRNMTDYKKKKYKFVLTDEQIAREREIYDGLFWPEYANLINDPKYINAGVAERANMISKMQSDLGEAAKRQLGDELRAAGYTSVLLDDSDVPEQVIDLYSLLNRG